MDMSTSYLMCYRYSWDPLFSNYLVVNLTQRNEAEGLKPLMTEVLGRQDAALQDWVMMTALVTSRGKF